MADPLSEDDLAALRGLVDVAHARMASGRKIIFENISDLFLSDEGRLSDRERALMGDIIGKLVVDMETRVREQLAQRLAKVENVPHDLVAMLANDQIDVARPLLTNSPLLRDADLVEVVRHRSQEHQLAVAMRGPLSAEVSEAIVDRGDEQVIEELLRNEDATLSRRALEYLVAESQRVDRYQEPLLQRSELPPDLAHRMFWWVSAALRKGIMDRFSVDPSMLDDAIQDAANAAIAKQPVGTPHDSASRLVEGLAEARQLDERFLVQALRGGKVAAFIAAFGYLCKVEPRMARRIVHDRSGESMAIACRAIGVERSNFASLFMLSRHGGGAMSPATLRDILKFYDGLTAQRARVALR
jgi:uncharacterized protein (DUF2336 family)